MADKDRTPHPAKASEATNDSSQDQAFGADLNAASESGRSADNSDSTPDQDNYESIRATNETAGTAGAGAPGLGGGTGGTPNYAGQGVPGGARALGAGAAPTRDANAANTPQTGGLGTPGGAAIGSHQAEYAHSGNADPSRATSSIPSAREQMSPEETSEAEAHAGAVESRGGPTPSKPGGDAANANPTHGDEAATLGRRSGSELNATPNAGGPMGNKLKPQDVYSPGAPDDETPTGDAGPFVDQPTPRTVHAPGPDAQI